MGSARLAVAVVSFALACASWRMATDDIMRGCVPPQSRSRAVHDACAAQAGLAFVSRSATAAVAQHGRSPAWVDVEWDGGACWTLGVPTQAWRHVLANGTTHTLVQRSGVCELRAVSAQRGGMLHEARALHAAGVSSAAAALALSVAAGLALLSSLTAPSTL